MAKKPKLLGTHQIVWRAFVLPPRNCGLIFSVFLTSLLISSILYLGYYVVIFPVIRDLADKTAELVDTDPLNPMFTVLLAAILKDVDELVLAEVLFFLLLFLVTTFTRTMIIYAIAATHIEQPLRLLSELLWRLVKVIKGAFVTQVYVAVLSLIYVALWGLVIFLLWHFLQGMPWLMPLIYFLGFVAIFFFVYLITLWSLSVAISVVESKHFGFKAVMRAIELYEGNKLRGAPIIVVGALLMIAVAWAYNLVYKSSRAMWIILLMVFARTLAFEILNLFILSSITVYYYECRRGREETVEVVDDFAYTSLPGGETRIAGEIVAAEEVAGNVAGEIREEEVRIEVHNT